MKNADAAKLASTFSDSAILQTINNKEGMVKVSNEKVQDFIFCQQRRKRKC